jgi:hypothetical protein
VRIDCNTQQAGIQTACSAARGNPHDVAVLIENTAPYPQDLAALGFDLHSDSIARLAPLPGPFSGLDGNPDFNNAVQGVWECQPLVPDTGDDGAGASVSRLSCYTNGFETSVATLAPGQALVFAVVHYNVPSDAASGDVSLRLGAVNAYDGTFSELGTCDPTIYVPIACETATVRITGDRVATPTRTPRPAPTRSRGNN